MVYKVIGLMSGSSLDGLDIAYVQLEEVRGAWTFQLLHTACIPYNEEWQLKLRHATGTGVNEFLRLHTTFGRYMGDKVNHFIATNGLEHKVHFVASHGHTVFHEPENHTTFQLGDGAALAATIGLPVINDLRALDVALGGQGAPIVPIGDKLLFGTYDYLLNIGGIANITVRRQNSYVAFDICPANQVLNALAAREGRAMDEGGAIASAGNLLHEVLYELNEQEYYKLPPPKSLSNDTAMSLVFPTLFESSYPAADMLHTSVIHIAHQVARSVALFPHGKPSATLLATGGGAFNTFLIEELQKALSPFGVEVVVPEPEVIKYKEALVMALIGVLRWREEANVMSSVTGADKDSSGGALWVV